MSLNESIVEDAALEWFGELVPQSREVWRGLQLAPCEPAVERESFGDAVLLGRFARGHPAASPAVSGCVSSTRMPKPFFAQPFFVIDTAFYLKSKAVLDLKLAYYELLGFDINSMNSGSAIPSTSRDDLCGIPVIVPPAEIQDAFEKIVGGWFAKVFANDHESRTLAPLRDTLLPKLLSGEGENQSLKKLNPLISFL